jgi:hypothetical protein
MSDLILADFFASEMHPWADDLAWDTYADMVGEVVQEVYQRHLTDQTHFPEEEQLTTENSES